MSSRARSLSLKGLPRDVEAPAAVPAPSRERSAEDAGHEADDAGRGGVQPDPDAMADDSMPELRREAEALGADAVALAEASSPASQQRAGAFGLIECRRGDGPCAWDGIWGCELTRSRPRRGRATRNRICTFFEANVLGFLSVAGAQHQAS